MWSLPNAAVKAADFGESHVEVAQAVERIDGALAAQSRGQSSSRPLFWQKLSSRHDSPLRTVPSQIPEAGLQIWYV